MATWAVLVVHGVGDTGPGVTVDHFLWSLVGSGADLAPDGARSVYWFADSSPGVGPGAAGEPTLFPVHVRRASITSAGAGTVGPSDALFAEVYWADLSRTREGTLHLLYGIISAIFFLRFIPNWAANLNGGWARWARLFLYAASWWLCGPVAALTAVLGYMLGGYYWVVVPLTRHSAANALANAGPQTLGFLGSPLGPLLVPAGLAGLESAAVLAAERFWMMALSGSAFLAALAAGLWARYREVGSTWTRLWYSCTVVALLLKLVLFVAAPASWGPTLSEFLRRAHLSDTAASGPLPYPEAVLLSLLGAIQVSFWALGAWLFVPTGVAWLGAWLVRSGGPGSRRALEAALAATLIQVTLWLLLIPPLAMLATRGFLPEDVRKHAEGLLFPSVRVWFMWVVLLTGAIALVAWLVWAWRGFLARDARPFVPPRHVPRLVVNAVIILCVIFLPLLLSAYFMLRVVAEWLGWWRPAAPADPVAEAITAGVLAVIGVGGALLTGGLRDWLHILMDILNHFYRRWEAAPWPWRPPQSANVKKFETQQLIEHRFKRALDEVLRDPLVTHLTVVAHSQGTVIAVDVLSLEALDPPDRAALVARLGRLTQFHLVTLGSPLTHLYHHYFPARYPSLALTYAWGGLHGVVRRWVNVFRMDDFIGTEVEPVPGWAGSPINVSVGGGGHTGYWRQKEVMQVLRCDPGLPPPVQAALGPLPSLPG